MKTAVISWGRMNPATIGHMKLIEKVNQEARRRKGDAMIFLSHSQDPKKNPLTYDQKIKWAKKSTRFPKSIIKSRAKNFFEVLTDVYDKGYTDLVVVVGADRIPEFKLLSNKYNGERARHGFYDFATIDVVSAGDRDPDAEGVEGMSASKVRAAVAQGDFELFKMGVSDRLSDADKQNYFDDIRRGMRIHESVEYTFKQYLTEFNAGNGQSLFDFMRSDRLPLILTPRMLERAIGELPTTKGFHVTDLKGLEKLQKLQHTTKSISVTTRPEKSMLKGLMTSGGIVAIVEGKRLIQSNFDLWSQQTREGLRVIRDMPLDLLDKIGEVWKKSVTLAFVGIKKAFEWNDDDKKVLNEIISTIKGMTYVTPAVRVRNIDISEWMEDFLRADYGVVTYQGSDRKTVGLIAQRMIKDYIDGTERVLKSYKNYDELWGVMGPHVTTADSKWNETILNDVEIQEVIVIRGIVEHTEALFNDTKFEEFLSRVKTRSGNRIVRVVENEDEFMQRYARLFEQLQEKWEMTVKATYGSDGTIEIFKNPTRSELSSIPSFKSMRAVRALVTPKGDFYAFDINLLHSRAVQVLGLPTTPNSTARIIVSWDDRKIRPSSTDSPLAMAHYLPNSKWADKHLQGFEAIVEERELDEEWFTMEKSYGQVFEVFKNPSSKELREIESYKTEKTVRAIILSNGDIYVFDVEFLHTEGLTAIENKLNKRFTKYAKIVIHFKDEFITTSIVDNAENAKPFVDFSPWIQRYCKGWILFGMDRKRHKRLNFVIGESTNNDLKRIAKNIVSNMSNT